MNIRTPIIYSFIIFHPLYLFTVIVDTISLPDHIERNDFTQDKKVPESPLYYVQPAAQKDLNRFTITYEETFFCEQWLIKDGPENTIAKINTFDNLYKKNGAFVPQLCIATLFVKEDHRNRNIGSALLAFVLVYKRNYSKTPIQEAFLTCRLDDEYAERREEFYKRFGFEPDEKTRTKAFVTMNLLFNKHNN